ncbi:MAG: ATP synthase F1 subunit delta [Pirellulaceae bacterium]
MDEIRHKTVFDTDQQHLGTVYAKALLGATEKTGDSETVMAELESVVVDVLGRLPALDAVLSSPRVAYERKEQILQRAFGNRMSSQLLNFLKVLARRGRFECLRAIQQATRRLFNEMRGRAEVEIRSAEPLDQETVALVTARLRSALNCDIDLQLEVDPELVAGLSVRVGDTVYDGSVANQLLRLRDGMIAKTNQKMRNELERFAKTDD